MPRIPPGRTVVESERADAMLARHAMSTYRAFAGVGAYHLARSDTRLFEWPAPHEVAGVASLGGRASHLEVTLSSRDVDESGARDPADELAIWLYTRAGRKLVLNVERTPQDTLELRPLPADVDALLPALRWACRQAAEGSY